MSSDVECKVCGSHNDAWLCKPCTTEVLSGRSHTTEGDA